MNSPSLERRFLLGLLSSDPEVRRSAELRKARVEKAIRLRFRLFLSDRLRSRGAGVGVGAVEEVYRLSDAQRLAFERLRVSGSLRPGPIYRKETLRALARRLAPVVVFENGEARLSI